jgi:hypothetical protein
MAPKKRSTIGGEKKIRALPPRRTAAVRGGASPMDPLINTAGRNADTTRRTR